MLIADAKALLEAHRIFRKKAGDAAWAKLTLQHRVGWSRFPCEVFMDDNGENVIVTFYDSVDGCESKDVTLNASEVEKF